MLRRSSTYEAARKRRGLQGCTRRRPAKTPIAIAKTIETSEISIVRRVAAAISGKYWGICSQCQVYTRRSGRGLLHPRSPRHLHEPRVVERIVRAARLELEDREVQPVAEPGVVRPHRHGEVFLREGREDREGALGRFLRANRDVRLVV